MRDSCEMGEVMMKAAIEVMPLDTCVMFVAVYHDDIERRNMPDSPFLGTVLGKSKTSSGVQ